MDAAGGITVAGQDPATGLLACQAGDLQMIIQRNADLACGLEVGAP